MTAKPKIATISLAGCFGCHMSLLDIDERILKLVELVDFDKSPINDIKEFTGRCAVGIIEGGCCNEENVHVLQNYRQHCDTLLVIGECATMGGRAGHAQRHSACANAWTRRICTGPRFTIQARRFLTILKFRYFSTRSIPVTRW